MLQQTQVATAIPYFHRFLTRFPTVRALAAASLDEVLALWSGLGYYARARNLHAAAQVMATHHAGELPRDLEALRALPGFGPYTAGAVGSIALGLDVPLVDGNVARVLCRIEGWESGAEESRARAWERAGALVVVDEAGDWNQALMELGQAVCTAKAPACGRCPVRPECLAAERGDPATYPLARPRAERRHLRFVALAFFDGPRVLLVRRERKGLFAGLWELPAAEIGPEGQASRVALRVARSFAGMDATVEPAAIVRQTLTHREVTVEPFVVQGRRARPPPQGRFVAPQELASLGLSSLATKTLRAVGICAAGKR